MKGRTWHACVLGTVLACATTAHADCPGRVAGTWIDLGDVTGAPELHHGRLHYLADDRLYLWGVSGDDSAAYDLCKGTWQAIASPPASLFAGHEQPIAGGRWLIFPSANKQGELGVYDTTTNTWLPEAKGAPSVRWGAATIWTGRELIVWGGNGAGGGRLQDGARFDPAHNRWQPIPKPASPIEFDAAGAQMPPAPGPVEAVWTGTRMLVWNGKTGATYDPATNTWTMLTTANGPTPRLGFQLLWTGSKAVIWGGFADGHGAPGRVEMKDGYLLDPTTAAWTVIAPAAGPDGRAIAATAGYLVIEGRQSAWRYDFAQRSTLVFDHEGVSNQVAGQRVLHDGEDFDVLDVAQRKRFSIPRRPGTSPQDTVTMFSGDAIVAWTQASWRTQDPPSLAIYVLPAAPATCGLEGAPPARPDPDMAFTIDPLPPETDNGQLMAATIDSKGVVHLVTATSDGASYMAGSKGSWTKEKVGAMDQGTVAIATDRDDHPHVTYMHDGQLHYAFRDKGRWTTEVVDEDHDTGRSSALAIDAAGRAHIAYSARGQVRYAYRGKDVWDVQIVEPAAGNEGTQVAIVLGPKDVPWVAMAAGSYASATVRLAHRASTGWQIETVDRGFAPSLAIDAAGTPHVAYGRGTRVRYATNTGRCWQSQAVPETNGTRAPRLRVGVQGPRIAAISSDARELHVTYAMLGSAGWSTAALGLQVESVQAFALDGASRPHVIYRSAADNKLAHAIGGKAP